jgi:hypothetical protein
MATHDRYSESVHLPAAAPAPTVRRRQVLLHHRAAAVRPEPLELAAMLERADKPDPACIAELRDLLANGCDSPLYNTDIHSSELRATLHHVRAGPTGGLAYTAPGQDTPR